MHKATMKSIVNHYKAGVKIPRLAADRGISIEMAVADLVEVGAVRIADFNQTVGQAKAHRNRKAGGK